MDFLKEEIKERERKKKTESIPTNRVANVEAMRRRNNSSPLFR